MSDTTVPSITVSDQQRGAAERLSERNSRLLLLGVVLYVALLSGLMIVRGIAVTPDVLLVGLGLAAVVLGRGRLFLRDWVPFIALFFAYELMRGYADDLGAAVHVTDVIALERVLALGALPTQLLQQAFHPVAGTDWLAVASTVFYFLHFPLPLAVGFLLWLKRRAVYYDYVASLILLCLAGFATYLVLPVAPPWWAAEHGFLAGPDGKPLITYLKPQGFDSLASLFGFSGHYIYTYTFYEIAPNPVAAFPSLHAAFPFLAFLFVRRAFGRLAGVALLAYFALLVFAIVYLADHYLVDAYAGVIYAVGAAWLVLHAPARLRAWLDRARDPQLESATVAAGPQPAPAGEAAAVSTAVGGPATSSAPMSGAAIQPVASIRPLPFDRVALLQGLALVLVGVIGLVIVVRSGAGNAPIALLPWALFLAGAWRAAVGVVRR